MNIQQNDITEQQRPGLIDMDDDVYDDVYDNVQYDDMIL